MTASALLGNIDGVRRFVVGDAEGRVLERSKQCSDDETVIAATAFAGAALGKMGSLLGLGAPQVLSVKTSGPWWIMALRKDNVFVVECDAARTASSVESTLLGNDWVALIESPIDDSEVEYVPTSQQSSVFALQSPARSAATGLNTRAEKSQRVSPPLARPTLPRPVPPVARPTGTRTGSTLQEAGAMAHSEALLAELRRNLVKGQLRQAENVADKLVEDAKSQNVPADTLTIPSALLEGIATVLAGDAMSGLASLKQIEKTTGKSPSLRWAVLIWCARACAGAGAGLEVANAYAQSALALASQLDTEARAVSTCELAAVVFHQGDAGEALELTHTARSLFVNTSDPQLLASCWLLEARVLAAIGSHEESVGAAAQAREQRPSWPPPATFIARRALQEGRLRDADNALQPLLTMKPTATEVERIHRIIDYVRSGVTPSQAAFDFLELVDAPPTTQNIRQLEELSEAYPRIEHFRDAFGWQLLRAGQYDSASVVFERLASRGELAEDVRSSVLLALGCLAAVGSRHAKPGVRIRAAVDATPKNFKSTKPLPPSSGKMKKAAPSDFRISRPRSRERPPELL